MLVCVYSIKTFIKLQTKCELQNVHLLFTDTDSLSYQIFTKDIYKDDKNDKKVS